MVFGQVQENKTRKILWDCQLQKITKFLSEDQSYW